MSEVLTIKALRGHAILPYIPDLARLRITVFREYPYLYEGDLAYEEKYLKTYTDCPYSTLIIVVENRKVIGASTGIPLQYEMPEIQAPFIKYNYDVSSIFYFGESVLLPDYRGQGIGKRFFEERESVARSHPGIKITAFCAVERTDPPKNYRSLAPFWQSQGYCKHPELSTFLSWKEIGEESETAKPMGFWLKKL